MRNVHIWVSLPGVTSVVCVRSVWVPCAALPSGGGSSVGPSPVCGSPVWVPCAGPLCGSPEWDPCVGPLCGSLVALRPCGIYSRDVSRSYTRSRSSVIARTSRLVSRVKGNSNTYLPLSHQLTNAPSPPKFPYYAQ